MVQESWTWTGQREQAAQLVADDHLTEAEIAAKVGVHRNSIVRWKNEPAFEARVQEHQDAYRARVRKRGIAIRERRVAALDDRWRKMQQVITERATAPEYADVAGGSTGLLVRQLKQIGAGREAQVVEEYAVDTGLLRELRAHEEQAAKELGQWVDKHAATDAEGNSLLDRLRDLALSVQEVPAHLVIEQAPD